MPRIITPGIIAEFRKRLCAAASELLAEKGLEGFNMREVAKRLRVSPMTTYRYFRDKNDILSELRAAAFVRLTERLHAAESSSSSPCEATVAMARAYCAFAQEERAHYRLMLETDATPSVQELELHATIDEHVRLLIETGIVDGTPEVLTRVFWSTLHGVTALYLTQRVPREDLDRVLCDAVAAFLRCDRNAIAPFAQMRHRGPRSNQRWRRRNRRPNLQSSELWALPAHHHRMAHRGWHS
jgi:AcrR family transcriptional regulator